jgi:hypothetical protein
MDPKKEILKLATIQQQGKFKFKGAEYVLDRELTDLNRDNSALIGKPLKKLVGTDKRGNTVNVWSHDCEIADHVVGKVKEPKLVSTVVGNIMSGVIEHVNKKNNIKYTPPGPKKNLTNKINIAKGASAYDITGQKSPSQKAAKKARIDPPAPSQDFTNKPQVLKPLRKAPPTKSKKNGR